MSSIRTNTVRRVSFDHFEPDVSDDPHAQKRLRGILEQIDYAAFACNREIIGQMVGPVDTHRMQRLAVSVAAARGAWLRETLAMSDIGHQLAPHQTEKVAQLRQAFEELVEAYEGLRRAIERGYLAYNNHSPK
jgi:hypothetical protein